MNYIDLGLPSGTLWCDTNEDDYYTFEEAISKYGNNLPTREQWEELLKECQWRWQWIGNGYKVTGPNGNTIMLPAAGIRNCNGNVIRVDFEGFYWSSTPHGSNGVWGLDFYSGDVGVSFDSRHHGGSVRLVKK